MAANILSNESHATGEDQLSGSTQDAAAGSAAETFGIRKIGIVDLRDALASGWDDFMAKPSHIAFLCVIYPVIGLLVTWLAMHNEMLPIIYPLVGGYALVGPIAAIGLYELSRRRELGHELFWTDAFKILRSPSIGAIATLSAGLMVLFVAWLTAAIWIYAAIFPAGAPATLAAFAAQVAFTPAGWTLIVAGTGIGFLFAVIVLTFGVVSFPMLVHRNVGVLTALRVSARAVPSSDRRRRASRSR